MTIAFKGHFVQGINNPEIPSIAWKKVAQLREELKKRKKWNFKGNGRDQFDGPKTFYAMVVSYDDSNGAVQLVSSGRFLPIANSLVADMFGIPKEDSQPNLDVEHSRYVRALLADLAKGGGPLKETSRKELDRLVRVQYESWAFKGLAARGVGRVYSLFDQETFQINTLPVTQLQTGVGEDVEGPVTLVRYEVSQEHLGKLNRLQETLARELCEVSPIYIGYRGVEAYRGI